MNATTTPDAVTEQGAMDDRLLADLGIRLPDLSVDDGQGSETSEVGQEGEEFGDNMKLADFIDEPHAAVADCA